MADAIADAQSGKSVHFREGAKREDVVVLAEKSERVGKIGTGSVLAVGLVEDDQNVTRDLCEEGVEFGGSERGPGRIVRVGDVDDSGLRRNRCGDGVEVEGKVFHWGLDERGAAGANGDRKEREGAFTGDAIKTRAKENARSQIDDFARAEADKNLFEAHPKSVGKDLAEMLAAAIGIPVGLAQS